MLKEIKDFPDYLVSDTGKVYSNYKNKGLRKLKTHKAKNGYLRVTLCKDKKHYTKTVHRLVAQAFIPNPENKPQINHINGNKTDNRVENLEFCTASENQLHARRVLGVVLRPNKGKLGKDNHSSKVVLQIKDMRIIAEFYGTREAYRQTGIESANIRSCCLGLRKFAGGYQWKYKTVEI